MNPRDALATQLDWLGVEIEQYLNHGAGSTRLAFSLSDLLTELGYAKHQLRQLKAAGYDFQREAARQLFVLGWQRAARHHAAPLFLRPEDPARRPTKTFRSVLAEAIRGHLEHAQHIGAASVPAPESLMRHLGLPHLACGSAKAIVRSVLQQAGWSLVERNGAAQYEAPPAHTDPAMRQQIIDAPNAGAAPGARKTPLTPRRAGRGGWGGEGRRGLPMR